LPLKKKIWRYTKRMQVIPSNHNNSVTSSLGYSVFAKKKQLFSCSTLTEVITLLNSKTLNYVRDFTCHLRPDFVAC